MYKLRSSFLSSVRPFFAPDDDRRAAAQAERDKIVVTSSKKPDVKEPEKEEVEKVEDADNIDTNKEDDKKSDDDGKDDDKEGDESGEDGENEGDDKKEEEGEKELTAEEYKKQLEAAQKKVARLERRTGKTAGERDELRKANATLKAALDAKVADGEGLTEEEVERRAEIKANEKTTTRAFEAAQAKLAKDATKVDKDFKDKINEVAEEVGAIPGAMIGILEDMDNGGAVLAYLANNPDNYEEVIGLNIAKMSNRLNKLSDKLIEDAKPLKKKISKVPAPIEPIKGGVESPSILPAKPNKDKDSMDKFVKMRQQQELERRKARYG